MLYGMLALLILYYIILYYVTLYHMIAYYIMLYRIILQYHSTVCNKHNRMHGCMYVCMHVRMYACMYVCMCIVVEHRFASSARSLAVRGRTGALGHGPG